MILLIPLSVVLLTVMVLGLRGDSFHNLLVYRVRALLEPAGFAVFLEHPIRLPDGRLNFIDLLACRDQLQLACEVETTARYVAVNAQKAQALDMPLWIIVPTQQLKQAVRRKVDQAVDAPPGASIQFLLPDELPQALTKCFPGFPAGKWSHGKHGKTEKTDPNGSDC